MITTLACLAALSTANLRVLFLGNSHTTYHNVPAQIEALARSVGSTMRFDVRGGAFLEDIARQPDVRNAVQKGRYDVVVMQAAKVSSSHRYVYSQENGIALAKLARQSGSRVVLFAEWPREGIDETEFILDVYRGIARASGAEIAPVGSVWDRVLASDSPRGMWLDGNHASAKGSYLAAQVLYRWIFRDEKQMPSFRSESLTTAESRRFGQVAMEAYRASLESGSVIR